MSIHESSNAGEIKLKNVEAEQLECIDMPEMTASHKEYLIARHGTLELDPMPSQDPADPLNWPRWKTNVNLTMVSFHALMIGFMTGGIIPAFQNMASDLGVTLDTASYTVSVPILLLGLAPLFWAPLADRYGRRPVWVVSTLLSMVANIGCARSKSYGTLMVARVFQAIFNAPAGALGTAVVAELFFARERGFKIGIWSLMVTLGNPVGPLVMGFVATRVGWRWIFWTFSAINGVQFLGYLFFSPETKYVRKASYDAGVLAAPKRSFCGVYLSLEKIPDSIPVKVSHIFAPVRLLTRPSVSISALAHSIIFGFCSVLICVEIPGLLGAKFGLNAEQIGLNFIGNIIGGVIGEQLSGPLSDYLRNRRLRRNAHHQAPIPEDRLWFAYPSYVLCIVGFVVFLVTLDNATQNHWTVAPVIGLAICAAGNQMQTTALFTYAVDRNLADSGGVGVSIILLRQIWSFIGPFWFPHMFDSIGLRGSAALCSALIVVFAVLPTAVQQFYIGPKNTW